MIQAWEGERIRGVSGFDFYRHRGVAVIVKPGVVQKVSEGGGGCVCGFLKKNPSPEEIKE